MTTTPLQMLVMQKARHAPTLASASNHSAFNLANAGGAWLGGVAIAAGWGWTSPTLVGAVLAADRTRDRRDGGCAGRGSARLALAHRRSRRCPGAAAGPARGERQRVTSLVLSLPGARASARAPGRTDDGDRAHPGRAVAGPAPACRAR